MKGNLPINKTVQRIVSGLLILLVVIGMLPTVFATGTGLEELPTEPTEGNESIDITEPTQLQDIGDPDIADTPPASSMEEEVTASRISIGGEDAPMLFATRAAIKGTHYHRAIIWLLGSDAKLNFTYKNNNYSVDRLYLHGVRVDGENHMAYCIDPGVLTTESSGGYSGSETAWSDLDIDTQTAVGLAVLYGAPNGMSSSDKKTNLTYEFATQIIIHEILLGYRSNLPPYSCTDERIIRKFGTNADGSMDNSNRRDISSDSAQYSSLHGQALDRKLLRSAYDQIAANMASHYVLPSFASRYNAGAKTYEMTRQSNGTYSVTLTDTNNVLSKCTFQNGNGLTYAVSGNKLTITSSGPFAEAKSCAQNGSSGAAKNVPDLEKQSFLVWEAGSRQRLVTLAEAQNDPVPIYFNVIAKESKGTAKIVKTTTNGGTVAGWTFAVKNADGNTVGTYTTDATGVITLELEPGTYSVTETNAAAKYWVNDPTPTKSITVKAGETSSVTFKNQYRGQAQIVKTTTNGGKLDGWHFTVKNASGTKIGDYVTDSTGIITLDLEPGTYTVTEVLEDDSLWQCTTANPQTITVSAGKTAKVTFANALRPGQITVYKVDTQGAPLAEAEFLLEWSADGKNWQIVAYTDNPLVQKGFCTSKGLSNGKLVSGKDGVVTFTGLYPTLQYRLTETKAPEGYQLLSGCVYAGTLFAEENLIVERTVVNAPVFALPMTGAFAWKALKIAQGICFGCLLILFGCHLYAAKGKKHR